MNTDLILSYLNDEMSASEKTAFEKQLQQNPALQAEVDSWRDILAGVAYYGDDQLKNTLQNVEGKLEAEGFFAEENRASKPVAKRIGLHIRYWAAAAAFIGLLGAAWWLLRPTPVVPDMAGKTHTPPTEVNPPTRNEAPQDAPKTAPTDPEIAQNEKPAAPKNNPATQNNDRNDRYLALAETHYTAPSLSLVRGGAEGIDSALVLYGAHDYAACIRWLSGHKWSGPLQWKSEWIQAHAHFELKQYNAALKLFESLTRQGVMPYSEESEFYLLLCYVAKYDKNKAAFDSLAQKILADKGHPQYAQTVRLVAEVR